MLARALTILALAAGARALCADPTTVEALAGRLAAVKAESSEACTATCAVAGSAYAYYRTGSCYCGPESMYGDDGAVLAPDCGMAYSVTYTFTPAGKGGTLAALQKRAAEECPANKMKCNSVLGTGFECVDVNTSTESCGGCVHGLYGVPESTSGEDCRFAPGVAPSGATCSAGQCNVTKCLEGWSPRIKTSDEGEDTGCIYHIYDNGIFRGRKSDVAWVTKHLDQYSFETLARKNAATKGLKVAGAATKAAGAKVEAKGSEAVPLAKVPIVKVPAQVAIGDKSPRSA